MTPEQLATIALTMTKGLGPVNCRNLIAYCGSAVEVLEAPTAKLLKISGVGDKMLRLIASAATNLERARQEADYCAQHGIKILFHTEADYPYLLKFIHDAPLVLYQKGKLDLNKQPTLAIVGTRKPTDYGKKLCHQFASFFAEQGVNVVSGLAFGVDIIAHKSVLAVPNGITTAVVGHGLDRVYPAQHTERAMQIVEKGAILSEFPSGTAMHPNNFPARNRIIAGLCKAVLVVEAQESGGALITARFAFDQNREVYAIPGNLGQPYSAGCNLLIKENVAKLALNPQDILEDLGVRWSSLLDQHPQQPTLNFKEANPEEKNIIEALRTQEMHIDVLCIETGLQMQQLHSLLLMMEFKNWVVQLPGKRFRLNV